MTQPEETGWTAFDLKVGDKVTFGEGIPVVVPGRLYWVAPGRKIIPYPTPRVKP